MKTSLLALFAIAVLIQWAAPLSQIWKYERVLASGTLVRLKCRAPDPYDPPDGTPVYAVLTPDEGGVSHISSLVLTPPASGVYVKTKLRWGSTIEWPFDRFYLNEKLAPEADKWLAENIRTEKGVIAVVRVLDGRAVLEDLTFEGQSFREVLKQRVK
jgi:hypothetical protein